MSRFETISTCSASFEVYRNAEKYGFDAAFFALLMKIHAGQRRLGITFSLDAPI